MKITRNYILPLVFLIAMVGLTYYLFFSLDILPDNEKRMTGIFTTLGLTFGLFQFWISEVNNSKRREFDLRYESYKEFCLIIDQITETLNQEMGDSSHNPHATVTKLLNLINQFQSLVKINSDFLFKELNKRQETKDIRDIIENILVRTDKFRKEIDDAGKKNPDSAITSLITTIGQMNWHNDTREHLKQLHDRKYLFYKAIRDYL